MRETYEPKPGAGWRKKVRADGRSAYGLMLEEGNEAGPCLFVALLDDDVFEIGYSPTSFKYQLPGPAQIRRVELDFGVKGWSVKGFGERKGQPATLLLQAVW